MAKKVREHLGCKFGVKLWIPSPALMDAAQSRTEGMVDYYLKVGESSYQMFSTERLRVLVASAYLQGVKDAAEAEAKQAERGRIEESV